IDGTLAANSDTLLSTQKAVKTYVGSQIAGTMLAANNLSDLVSKPTSRTNLGLGSAATLASDADGTLAANSDTLLSTQKAVKTYVGAQVAGKMVAANNLSDLVNKPTSRTNLGLGSAATLASDVDGTLAANSDNLLSTQKAVKTFVGSQVAGIKSTAPGGTLAIPLDDKLDEVVSVTGWMTSAYDS